MTALPWLLALALAAGDEDLLLVPESRALLQEDLSVLELRRRYVLETVELSLEAVERARRLDLLTAEQADALAARIEPLRATFSVPLPERVPPGARSPLERFLAARALSLLPSRLYDRAAVEAWNDAARRFLAEGDAKEFARLGAAFRTASQGMLAGGRLLSFLYRLRRGPLSGDEIASWRKTLTEIDPWLALAGAQKGAKATAASPPPAVSPDSPALDGVERATRRLRTVQEWLRNLGRGGGARR